MTVFKYLMCSGNRACTV